MLDSRRARRVVRDEAAPPTQERWLYDIPAVAQLLSDGLELAEHGGQVLCAPHSPIVASTPGARVLELGPLGMREVKLWEDLELVQHWRAYLEEPDRYLRHLRG